MNIVLCTVCSVKFTVYSIQCIVYSVQYTVYIVKFTLYRIHLTLFRMQCSIKSDQCPVYSAVGAAPMVPSPNYFPVSSYSKFTSICVRVWEGQNDRLTKVPISVVRMCDCKNVGVGDLLELLSPSTS